jgi:low temperature requirement protein LtrA
VLREHLVTGATYAEKRDAFYDYAVFFFTIWRYWTALTSYCTRYGSDDLFNKIFISLYMFGVVGMIIHCKVGPFTDPTSADTVGFAASGALSSAFMFLMYTRVAFYLPGRPRRNSVHMGSVELITCLLWLASAFGAPAESRGRIQVFAFFLYFLGWTLPIVFAPCLWTGAAQSAPAPWYKRYFCRRTPPPPDQACWPLPPAGVPLHLEHMLERHGCMLVVFLGETVDDITDTAKQHSLTFYWVCGLCFVVVSATKILFFDSDCEVIDRHALRTDRMLGLLWNITNAWSWFSIALMCVNTLRRATPRV